MNYGSIRPRDVANGPGVRVVLFVSGCRHHCKGCFNAETWDFSYGEPFTKVQEQQILDYLKPDYVQGITVLGGEPFEPENQPPVAALLKKVREAYPTKDIWCYSGYLYDADMIPGGRIYTESTDELLSYIDVLVDGEFVLAEKDLSLQFRGSRNQRIIYLK